jgi:hypothetical protein
MTPLPASGNGGHLQGKAIIHLENGYSFQGRVMVSPVFENGGRF